MLQLVPWTCAPPLYAGPPAPPVCAAADSALLNASGLHCQPNDVQVGRKPHATNALKAHIFICAIASTILKQCAGSRRQDVKGLSMAPLLAHLLSLSVSRDRLYLHLHVPLPPTLENSWGISKQPADIKTKYMRFRRSRPLGSDLSPQFSMATDSMNKSPEVCDPRRHLRQTKPALLIPRHDRNAAASADLPVNILDAVT